MTSAGSTDRSGALRPGGGTIVARHYPGDAGTAAPAANQPAADHAAASRHAARAACRTRGGPAVHEHHVLALYTGGHARMEQRGRWELHPGDALLVPAGEPHRLLEASRAEYWGLAFVAAGAAPCGSAALLEPFERVRDGAAAVVRIPSERQELLHTVFRELARVSAAPPGADAVEAAVQSSLLTLILGEVARAARSAPPALASAPGQGVVGESLRFIERHCLRRLTLEDVAAAVGRSPAHVTTALSRATGRSASHWILGFRMAEARRLLLHSDLPVGAIAERVGYADSTHFGRMFRREHGHTPAAWRAARRG